MKSQDVIVCLNSMIENISIAKKIDVLIRLKQLTNKQKYVKIEKEYRNLSTDVIKDFYIPVLRETVIYKRAVGFFNSSALYEIAVKQAEAKLPRYPSSLRIMWSGNRQVEK